jgi:hypothetical protein
MLTAREIPTLQCPDCCNHMMLVSQKPKGPWLVASHCVPGCPQAGEKAIYTPVQRSFTELEEVAAPQGPADGDSLEPAESSAPRGSDLAPSTSDAKTS